MACFSSFFWSRRKEDSAALTSSDDAPWFVSGVEQERVVPPPQIVSSQIRALNSKSLCDVLFGDKRREIGWWYAKTDGMTDWRTAENKVEDTRVRGVDSDSGGKNRSARCRQMALGCPDRNGDLSVDVAGSIVEEDLKETDNLSRRFRRTGVYEILNISPNDDDVGKVAKKTEVDQENLLAPPASGYCSSAASAGSEDESEKLAVFRKNQVRRCESLDSAIVHSDEESTTVNSNWGETREEIEELPYRYPVFSPYSPRRSVDHENVPSRTLLEAQFVALPLDRKASDAFSEISEQFTDDSRRQSCFTDDGDEIAKYRYWRTPSVVVSDYSDDPMGLTLEDIEYIRNKHQEASSSPDSSLHSSYSNLNLYGSNPETYRKVSDCSTCSLSGDEDGDYSREDFTGKEAFLHMEL